MHNIWVILTLIFALSTFFFIIYWFLDIRYARLTFTLDKVDLGIFLLFA